MRTVKILSIVTLGAFLLNGCGNETTDKEKSLSKIDNNIQPYKTQKVFIGKFSDKSEYHIRDDDESIFLKIYKYDKNIDKHSQFCIDIDNNRQTGYGENGVDYIIEDNRLYKYTGTGDNDWNWEMKSTIEYEYIGKVINENSYDRYKYKFEHSQWVKNGIIRGADMEPRYHTPYLIAKIPKNVLVDLSEKFSTYAIKIDANWSAINHSENKNYIISNNFLKNNDFYYQGSTPLVQLTEYNNSLKFNSWRPKRGVEHTQYYFDIDNNSNTGYITTSGNVSGGYEYLLEDDRVYKYTGETGSSWKWEEIDKGTYGISTYEHEKYSYSITSTFLKKSIKFNQSTIKITPMYFDENWVKIGSFHPVEIELNIENSNNNPIISTLDLTGVVSANGTILYANDLNAYDISDLKNKTLLLSYLPKTNFHVIQTETSYDNNLIYLYGVDQTSNEYFIDIFDVSNIKNAEINMMDSLKYGKLNYFKILDNDIYTVGSDNILSHTSVEYRKGYNDKDAWLYIRDDYEKVEVEGTITGISKKNYRKRFGAISSVTVEDGQKIFLLHIENEILTFDGNIPLQTMAKNNRFEFIENVGYVLQKNVVFTNLGIVKAHTNYGQYDIVGTFGDPKIFDIELSADDKIAYTISKNKLSLDIFDVTDPANVIVKKSISLSSEPIKIELRESSNRLFISLSNGTTTVIDISKI